MNKSLLALVLLGAPLMQAHAQTQAVDIELTLPKGNQHRPYVAVWVENAGQEPVKTLAVWQKEADWLKDMRRWWRKTGRYDQGELDAVTGATRKPGSYQLSWDGTDSQGQPVAAGEYLINIEAAREHGGRSLVQQTIMLGGDSQTQHLEPSAELGAIRISTR